MPNKRGQLTIFIIIAIIILACAAAFLIFKDRIILKSPEADEVSTFVKQCLEDITSEGIYLLATKGGYIYSFDKTLNLDNVQVAYHMEYNDESIAPMIDFMEGELSRFIGDSLKGCILVSEKPDYYKLELCEMNVKPKILSNSILVKLHYPITIITNESETTISDFSASIPIRLGYILDVKRKVLKSLKDSGKIDFDLLSSFDAEVS